MGNCLKLLVDETTFNSLRAFLRSVAGKEGAYAEDPLTHASNVIDGHATQAQTLLEILYGEEDLR